MACTDRDSGTRSKTGGLVGIVVAVSALVGACGDSAGQVTTPSTSLGGTTSTLATTTTQQSTPDDGEVPNDFEGLGVPLPNTPDVIVAPGETGLIPLQFEGERGATIILFLDSYENVTARFGDTLLEEGPFLGGEVLGVLLDDPADGNLEVVNGGSQQIMGGVIVFLDSPRHLTVSAEPHIRLGETVEITVTLTEPDPEDQPEVLVSYSDDIPPVELVLDAVSPGVWTAAFTPEQGGHFTAVAQVEGTRPRFDSTTFQVDVDGPAPPATGGGD